VAGEASEVVGADNEAGVCEEEEEEGPREEGAGGRSGVGVAMKDFYNSQIGDPRLYWVKAKNGVWILFQCNVRKDGKLASTSSERMMLPPVPLEWSEAELLECFSQFENDLVMHDAVSERKPAAKSQSLSKTVEEFYKACVEHGVKWERREG
jgi:hypothetical protein